MNTYEAERYIAECDEEEKANKRFRAWQIRNSFEIHRKEALAELKEIAYWSMVRIHI